jgi:hypothetical protein
MTIHRDGAAAQGRVRRCRCRWLGGGASAPPDSDRDEGRASGSGRTSSRRRRVTVTRQCHGHGLGLTVSEALVRRRAGGASDTAQSSTSVLAGDRRGPAARLTGRLDYSLDTALGRRACSCRVVSQVCGSSCQSWRGCHCGASATTIRPSMPSPDLWSSHCSIFMLCFTQRRQRGSSFFTKLDLAISYHQLLVLVSDLW